MSKMVEKINPLEKAVEVVGKKHDLLILDYINSKNKRAGFNQILKGVKGVNPRILSMRLKDFEKNKLVTKNIILGTPMKTEYTLTPKAEELIGIIEKLKEWVRK